MRHWEIFRGAMIFCSGTVFAVLGWVLLNGGLPGLHRWNETLERTYRRDSHKLIVDALQQLTSKAGGRQAACDEVIAGLDQWRLSQDRYKSRAAIIRRAVLQAALLALGVVSALGLKGFEADEHKYSATAVVFSFICLAWIAWDWTPLIYLAFKDGVTPSKDE